ncbi:MAG TPA: c-type cytochrome [Vicinamibacterales bacterium]|jgi:mono/diheme cytochrome c family protein|nr:c-type cytochrome [Vicinamibacterales bacterium]
MKTSLLLCWILAAAPANAPAQAARPAPVSRAKAVELYNTNCQLCHGPDGVGTPLTKDLAFAGRKWKHGSSQPSVIRTITTGVAGTPMLPFKDRLSPAEISALASLVRSYDKALKPAPAVKK